MEDKLKWVAAAGLTGFMGFALWQFVRESTTPRRKRQPWETV
jgi:hypothetical protein